MHSTNYKNTFILIADDSPINKGEMPPLKGEKKTVANWQFELLFDNPYQYTSDDVIFKVFAIRKEFLEEDYAQERENFFSKGQPCFRASPLTKRYGWGVHSDAEGRVALFGSETPEYKAFIEDTNTEKVLAMRSKRK